MSLPIIWKGSPNFWPGRDGHAVVAIINHVTMETLDATNAIFADPVRAASTHFCVGKLGQIHQYVHLDDTAWANGPMAQPDPSCDWLMAAVAQKVNPNRLTISIEHEGMSGEPLTEPQYQASLALHRQIIAEYHIPKNRQYVTGHYAINFVERSFCPGPAFPWSRLMADLGA